MKIFNKTLIAAISATALLASCTDQPEAENSGDLEIVFLSIGSETIVPGNDLTFTASVRSGGADLSTLEVSVISSDGEIAEASFRTRGTEATVTDGSITVPFLANMAEGTNLGVRFELIDVNGASINTTRQIAIERPQLPETIYMITDAGTYSMTRSADNQELYTTSETGFDNALTATFATSDNIDEAEYIWGDSGQNNVASIIEVGGSGVTINFPSMSVDNYTFNTLTFEVGATGTNLDISVNGTALTPDGSLLHAQVEFTQDAAVTITGISDLESCYNRDFFSYADGNVTFLGESGTYDVYYSTDYNYFWIAKMDAVAPECLWINGHGFTCAPRWSTDYNTGGWVGMDEEGDPLTINRVGYARRISDNEYQCHMYLSNDHEWANFEFEIYSDLEWNIIEFTSIAGDTEGIVLSENEEGPTGGITSASEGFEDGYYRVVFNTSTYTATFERLTEYVGPTPSGQTLNGVSLTQGDGFSYASISFTKGAEVSFGGFTDMAAAYNRDFFSYEDGKLTFLRESGTWNVRYYEDYNYIWVYNYDLSAPDCLYILGNGKMSCPQWYNDLGAPGDFFYSFDVPYACIAPSDGNGSFQATMYLSDDNDYKDVRLEIYTGTDWGKPTEYMLTSSSQLSGDSASLFSIQSAGKSSCNLYMDTITAGYYRFVFTPGSDGMDIEITKISE